MLRLEVTNHSIFVRVLSVLNPNKRAIVLGNIVCYKSLMTFISIENKLLHNRIFK